MVVVQPPTPSMRSTVKAAIKIERVVTIRRVS
jgi:hypothetical protein